MGKWEKVILGNVATIQAGYSFKSEKFQSDGVPIIRIGNLNGNTVEVDEGICYPKSFWDGNPIYRVNPRDILIAMSGATVGKIGIYNSDSFALLNQRVGKISVNEALLNNQFAYRYLQSSIFINQIKEKAFGCAQPNISSNQISEISIPLPPLKTQNQIAKTLDNVSELLAMRQQKLAELDNLIKAVFYEMFGDPEQSPFKWKIDLLKNVSKIISGVTKGRRLNELNLKSVPYMRVANVQDGHLNLSEIKYIDVSNAEIEKYKLINGDLLMTEGGDPDKLGRCAIWGEAIPLCIHQNHIFRVRLNRKLILPLYASYSIGSLYGKRYFLRAAKQTTGIASINSKQLNNFPIMIPDMSLQQRFVSIVIKIEHQKSLVKKSIDETQYLLDSLMSEYFE